VSQGEEKWAEPVWRIPTAGQEYRGTQFRASKAIRKDYQEPKKLMAEQSELQYSSRGTTAISTSSTWENSKTAQQAPVPLD
jgi:hypothetical protein